MARIVLISCSATKFPHSAKARELYSSPLFRYSLAYAEMLQPDAIYILSAKHHLLALDTVIEPYNVTIVKPKKEVLDKNPTLKVLTAEEKVEWGKQVVSELAGASDLLNDEFIILAGKAYMKPLQQSLAKLVDPLHGLKQGERLQKLKQLLNA